jgi:hypothetical protein
MSKLKEHVEKLERLNTERYDIENNLTFSINNGAEIVARFKIYGCPPIIPYRASLTIHEEINDEVLPTFVDWLVNLTKENK